MRGDSVKLADFIKVDNKLSRSINIERDLGTNFLQHYSVTSKTQALLERFISALSGEKVTAWSLVGPYGMGKSAFLAFFLYLVGIGPPEGKKIALNKLKKYNPSLHNRFIRSVNKFTGNKGFFIVSAVASFEPINRTLARGLRRSVIQSKLPSKKIITSLIDTYEKTLEVGHLVEAFSTLKALSESPVIIIVDELGKNLEYMSFYSHDGDLFIMQQLAEMERAFLFVSLHQAIGEYFTGFSEVQQREWSKIQGRFEEIPFTESMLHTINLIKDGINQPNKMEAIKKRINAWGKKIWADLEENQLIDMDFFTPSLIADIYPIHPITCIALAELCKVFAQNDRTLSTFIASGQPYALPALLKSIEVAAEDAAIELPSIGLDSLYDYFLYHNTQLGGRPEAQRWLEIQSILALTDCLPAEEIVVLKSIGVLNILSGVSGLHAYKEILLTSLVHTRGWAVDQATTLIESLQNRGVIFYRDYADEYRLWEGSDFDVSEAIKVEKSKLVVGSIEEYLEEHLPLSPFIASQHSIVKGTIRKFKRTWRDATSVSTADKDLGGHDGLLMYCYGSTRDLPITPHANYGDYPVVVVYAPVKENISEIALEYFACLKVKNYPQLVRDSVARREINHRAQALYAKFKDYAAQAFLPGSEGLIWYARGRKTDINTKRQLSKLLSQLCDEVYTGAPPIANEIISGDNLTGIAVRARRELVEAMATKSLQENLGLSGWGPEIAMYRSLILKPGFHRFNPQTGHWRLTLESNNESFQQLWHALDTATNEPKDLGATVEDLLEVLNKPPFGLRQGPALLYIALYIMANSEDIAVFHQGLYLPYLSAADVALLLKRPDLFTVKKVIADQLKESVFTAYRNMLHSSGDKLDAYLRNATMIGVIGPLMKFVDQLTRYSKQTKNLTPEAIRARSAINNAVDPLEFLFEELPTALGINTENIDSKQLAPEIEARLKNAMEELSAADERLLARTTQAVLKSFHLTDIELLHAELVPVAKGLSVRTEDSDLKAFLNSLSRNTATTEDWVKGIVGIVVRKPLDAWQDEDFDVFEYKIEDFAERTQQLKALLLSNIGPNTQIISIMGHDGVARRRAIPIDSKDQQIENALKYLDNELNTHQKRALLALLAKELIGGD
jgi:hypothetical protein